METDPLEAAINEADKLNLIDPETLEAGLNQLPPYPGLGKLKATLARYTTRSSRRFGLRQQG